METLVTSLNPDLFTMRQWQTFVKLHSLNDSHCTASVAATSTSSLCLHPAMALKPLKSLFPQIDPNPNANLLPESHLADATWKRMPKNMSAALCCHNRYFEFLTKHIQLQRPKHLAPSVVREKNAAQNAPPS